MAGRTQESGNGFSQTGFEGDGGGAQTRQWEGDDFQQARVQRRQQGNFEQDFEQRPQFSRQGQGESDSEEGNFAGRALGEAREKASQVARNAGGAVKGEIQNRSGMLGAQAFALASDLRQAAESLRNEGSNTMVADLAEQASMKIEDAARYVQSADLDQLTDDLKRLAKQQPWLVAAGLFAVGFGASRLIKATVNENGGRR